MHLFSHVPSQESGRFLPSLNCTTTTEDRQSVRNWISKMEIKIDSHWNVSWFGDRILLDVIGIVYLSIGKVLVTFRLLNTAMELNAILRHFSFAGKRFVIDRVSAC